MPLKLFPVYQFFLAVARILASFGVRLYVSIVAGGSTTTYIIPDPKLSSLIHSALTSSYSCKAVLKGRGFHPVSLMKYEMIIAWSEEDDCYLVGFPDFPGQKWRTHGDTYEMAVNNGVEALESLVLAYETSGESLPKPKAIAA